MGIVRPPQRIYRSPCSAFVVYGQAPPRIYALRGIDLATDDNRARSLSYVLLGTTAGAVAGPNLVGPTGAFADTVGMPTLTGPFMLAAVAYGGAAIVIFLLLRPDPLLESRCLDAAAGAAGAVSVTASSSSGLHKPPPHPRVCGTPT